MRDLSLHILDLMENSLRVGATVVAVAIDADTEEDRLRIAIEDNGPGLAVGAEAALSPFYTTKEGKKTGLGLSLFKAAAERAEGGLVLVRSPLGGLAVRAEMQYSHVDRSPLGDLAGTLAAVCCTHPEVDVRLRLRVDGVEVAVGSRELLETAGGDPLLQGRLLLEKVRAGLSLAWPPSVW